MQKIQNQLYTATMSGDVESLNDLLKKDKSVLNRYSTLSGFSNETTPLHIAATQDYVQFAKILLQHKPSLVSKLDLQLRSPLHMACENGHVEMVGMLLTANADLCLMEDHFGRTPLHIAAMAGSVQVVNKLVTAKPEAIMYPLNRTKTVTLLHLYVMRNGVEALKQLVEVDHTFLDSQDGEGNTILHKVVSLKKMEILKYLVSCIQMDVNLKNQNSLTARDIIEKIPRDEDTANMKLLLGIGAGVSAHVLDVSPTATSLKSTKETLVTSTEENIKPNELDAWLEKRTNALLISATLIASMAFQAGINPPGGVWGEDKQHQLAEGYNTTVIAGKSILATNSPDLYTEFLWFNRISFVASLSLVLLLISGPPPFSWFGPCLQKVYMWLLTIVVWVIATMTTLTYLVATYGILPYAKEHWTAAYHDGATTNWVLTVWIIFIGCVFLVYFLHMLYYGINRYIKRGEGEQQSRRYAYL